MFRGKETAKAFKEADGHLASEVMMGPRWLVDVQSFCQVEMAGVFRSLTGQIWNAMLSRISTFGAKASLIIPRSKQRVARDTAI